MPLGNVLITAVEAGVTTDVLVADNGVIGAVINLDDFDVTATKGGILALVKGVNVFVETFVRDAEVFVTVLVAVKDLVLFTATAFDLVLFSATALDLVLFTATALDSVLYTAFDLVLFTATALDLVLFTATALGSVLYTALYLVLFTATALDLVVYSNCI